MSASIRRSRRPTAATPAPETASRAPEDQAPVSNAAAQEELEAQQENQKHTGEPSLFDGLDPLDTTHSPGARMEPSQIKVMLLSA